mmetsp:Transcript_17560/g.27349  ORF Transcript_17560/g.27349 Transcript_17560/m.27349 type:complete len:198 (+) Transcript_17560:18-611(+)|eukprot:CAMPEP_0196807730 /NCGR_PEP_ID=MMETSP1362-20130617/7729_1 /TAXON_ID=163516 /ORGANISM="Leptocylindrus danicus, Strain CCMP1856" /LENGTH=197 /DNA_ID=CAMNT_0042181779 /DNA_START=19 /DNA_END=612 /DNA_ORIENTATION=-
MAATTAWDSEYTRLSRRATEMRTTAVTLSDLQGLKQELSVFNEGTLKATNTTPTAEMARRKSMLDSLTRQLDEMLRSSASSMKRGNTSSNVSQKMSDNSDLVMMQRQAMSQQNEQLLELSSGLETLKLQSMRIGEEADMHASLLDNIEGNVTGLDEEMGANLERARFLNDKTNYNQLYFWIAVLSGILILQIMLKVS